ncbi:MAG: hypothetical protein IT167_19505, partial [Bryobacterales bacterium]|nr:hypothetical protein [Bryobacterales bacterium]
MKRINKLHIAVCWLSALLVLLVSAGMAQIISSSIVGQVSDSSGAGVPEAQV